MRQSRLCFSFSLAANNDDVTHVRTRFSTCLINVDWRIKFGTKYKPRCRYDKRYDKNYQPMKNLSCCGKIFQLHWPRQIKIWLNFPLSRWNQLLHASNVGWCKAKCFPKTRRKRAKRVSIRHIFPCAGTWWSSMPKAWEKEARVISFNEF